MYNKNRFEGANFRYRTHSTNYDVIGDDNDANVDNMHVIVLFYGFIFHFQKELQKCLNSNLF
jgi:hypothetical protein